MSGPLRECPNVLLTPRTARYSDQGLMELRQMAAEEMRRAVLGQLPSSLPHCINAHALNASRSGRPTGMYASSIFTTTRHHHQLHIADICTVC